MKAIGRMPRAKKEAAKASFLERSKPATASRINRKPAVFQAVNQSVR